MDEENNKDVIEEKDQDNQQDNENNDKEENKEKNNDEKENKEEENKENETVDIIPPEEAKEIISAKSNEVINFIKNKEFEKLAKYVHPEKGVRFTPYTHVSVDDDIVFSKEEMKNFFKNDKSYLWGHYDGKGNEIKLTPRDYYSEFIYNKDFAEADEIGYNKVLSSGNMLENQFKIYDNPIVVEYYFPYFEEEYKGMDWQSLRLVYEKYNDEWYLVGIIHNQWTI
ncbi:hypothetical protein [Dethiothermospora halolimnae]|uniref:hypothetical protein n=1 Tax=Dethiothermospora halolimnae TaxID=3114390 RepID=UPI003CCB7E09